MKVFFPKTNPILFQDSSYKQWQDCLLYEYQRTFVQRFILSDLLSFQVIIDKQPADTSRIKVYLQESKRQKMFLVEDLGIGSTDVGNYPSSFVKTLDLKRCVYCFSKEFQYFASRFFNQKFKVVIVIGNKEFISNELMLCSQVGDTKKIHYNHIVEYSSSVYDTYFSLMPLGYDIRLSCSFLQQENKSNDEVYQAYDGTYQLVSSVPYCVVTLQFSQNGVGFPDWLIEHLNYILHCQIKYIDGVRYQVTQDSQLEVQIVDRYNNRFCTIQLSKLQKEQYDVDSNFNISIYVDYDSHLRNGTLTIVNNQNIDVVISGGKEYSFSQNIVEQTCTVDFVVEKNLSSQDILTDIQFLNIQNNSILKQITLKNAINKRGICNWSICGNFMVEY